MTPAATWLADFLERRTGQQLSPARRWRIDVALAPIMVARHLADPEAVVGAPGSGDPDLAEAVIDALLNHETSFLRGQAAFAQLVERVLPHMAEARRATRSLRLWSAGCSTGQEAYSLALAFARDPARWAGWSIDILGTDIACAAVERARSAIYSQFEVQRGLSMHDMVAMFDRGGECWRVADRLRRFVRFRQHNLLAAPPTGGPFDIVLCRNVLLYFTPPRRGQVIERLAAAMAPDGVLMLGAGETLLDRSQAFIADAEFRGLYRPCGHGAARSEARPLHAA